MLIMVMVMAGVTGCSASAKETGPPAPPAAAASASAAASIPPARYTAVDGDACPTLRSEQAKQFNASGPGREFRSAQPAAGALAGSACSWGSGSGTDRPLLNAEVLIFANGLEPTGTGIGNATRFYNDNRGRGLREAGEPGAPVVTAEQDTTSGRTFFSADATIESLTQTSLMDNAVVTVTVWRVPVLPTDPAGHAEKLLSELSAVTGPITDEIVAQLR